MLYRDYLKSKYQNTAVKLANAEGVPCVLEYSKGKNMRNYEVYGNSVQDGTPSPESPVEIQSVGDLITDTESEYYGKYDIPITVTGKNLFDMDTILPQQGWVKQDDGSYYVANNGTVRNKVLWENTEKYTGQLKILFQAKYAADDKRGSYLWVNYTDGTSLVVYYTGTVVANTWYYPTSSRTITDSNKIVQNIVWTYGTGSTSTWVKDIIITKDTTDTAYEPYKGSITEHIYLDEPLRKVGDYADYIDFKNQKVVRKVKHREFSSNNNWSVYSSAAHHFQIIVGDNYFAQVEGVKAMSNYYPQYSGKYHSTTSLDYAVLSADGSRLRFRDIRYTTLDEWKTFLDTLETPLAVNYILATPTEENISLPALKTFKGTNVMSVDTAVLPSNIKAKYIRT